VLRTTATKRSLPHIPVEWMSLSNEEGPHLCGPSGGAAGNRTRYKNRADLRKHRI
jgi:hypothetical protein